MVERGVKEQASPRLVSLKGDSTLGGARGTDKNRSELLGTHATPHYRPRTTCGAPVNAL